MDYGYIWLLLVVASSIFAIVFFYLFRTKVPKVLLAYAMGLMLSVFLTPAPIPGYVGYAPALVVVIFEGLMRAEGEAVLALRILLFSIFGVFLLITAGVLGTKKFFKS
tara:strand:- start:116 stop:439 length:324 start_codon:yes stop_codon:yes gene_type:complete